MVIITGLCFFGNVCCFRKHGRSLIERQGGMLQKFGNRGLNHQTTHCVAQLALHLAQPRLWCHSPLPSKGPWQGNNYNYTNNKKTKRQKDIEKKCICFYFCLSLCLSVCPLVLLFRIHSIIASCFSVCCYSCCCCLWFVQNFDNWKSRRKNKSAK